MAGLTSSAWSEKVVNGRLVLECDLTQVSSTTEDSFTLKTPANRLDTTKSWILYVNTEGTAADGQALAVDLWAGWDDQFALTSANPPTATYGAEIASAVMTTVQAKVNAIRVDPNYTGTVVAGNVTVGGIVNAGTAPYYIINLDGGSTLGAVVVHVAITQ